MPKAAAPTADDLRALLRSANLLTATLTTAQGNTDFESAIAGAVTAWEQATEYIPFIATEQTREFEPPNRLILPLRAGVLSVSEVRINVSTSNPVGTLLTQNTDFRLGPRFAAGMAKPYTHVEFRFRPTDYGILSWITVKGIFGYAILWPDDAWNAVLKLAGRNLLAEFQQQLTSGTLRIKEGDEERAFNPKPLGSVLDIWQGVIDSAVSVYHRRAIY